MSSATATTRSTPSSIGCHNPGMNATTPARCSGNSPSSFSTTSYHSHNSTDVIKPCTSNNSSDSKLPSIPDNCEFVEVDAVKAECKNNNKNNLNDVKIEDHDNMRVGDKVNDPLDDPETKKKLKLLENRFMGPPLNQLQQLPSIDCYHQDTNNSSDSHNDQNKKNGSARGTSNGSNSSSNATNTINNSYSQHSFNFESIHPATPSSKSNIHQLNTLQMHGKQSPALKTVVNHIAQVEKNLASKNAATNNHLAHSHSHPAHSNAAHSYSNNSSRSMSVSSNQTLITAHVTNNNINSNSNHNKHHHAHNDNKFKKNIMNANSTATTKTTARRSISTSISSTVSPTLSTPSTPSKRKASQPTKLSRPSLSNRKHQHRETTKQGNKRRKTDSGIGEVISCAPFSNTSSVITPNVEKNSTPLSPSLSSPHHSTPQQPLNCIPNTSCSSSLGTNSNHQHQKEQPKLTSFFPSVKKGSSSLSSSRNNNKNENLSSLSSFTSRALNPQVQPQQSQIASYEQQIQQLRSQISSLHVKQQKFTEIINDKNEQLKAIHNNQTIITTQLKLTLSQREEEIKKIISKIEVQSIKYQSVVEDFIYKDVKRVQLLKRQQIASDCARLGRWVYNRVGMRVEPVWEDGIIGKELKVKRVRLSKKRETLEKRLKDGMDKLQCSQDKPSDIAHGIGNDNYVNSLEREEFEQSIRIHLEELEKEEQELQKEEDATRLEKASHKRELRRVANEDASRFKNRPKLHDRYIPMYQLGKGGFSEVWRCYDLVELREVAVKIHQLDPRWSEAKIENYTKHVAREYEIHRDVRHPRIVSLYDVFEIDKDSFATVLEVCDGTDLDTLLQERKMLSEKHARAILLQILSGMKYLSTPSKENSRQGIIHYDLKPGNILFDEFGDAKITDFGLSKIMDSPDPSGSMELTSQGAGTYWYLPPECFVTSASVRITNRVDVWSIGVIFYQMLYGKRPFGDGQSQERVLTNNVMLNAREVRFPDIPTVSKEAKNFIRLCLTYEQALRPNIAELCENQYVRGKK